MLYPASRFIWCTTSRARCPVNHDIHRTRSRYKRFTESRRGRHHQADVRPRRPARTAARCSPRRPSMRPVSGARRVAVPCIRNSPVALPWDSRTRPLSRLCPAHLVQTHQRRWSNETVRLLPARGLGPSSSLPLRNAPPVSACGAVRRLSSTSISGDPATAPSDSLLIGQDWSKARPRCCDTLGSPPPHSTTDDVRPPLRCSQPKGWCGRASVQDAKRA